MKIVLFACTIVSLYGSKLDAQTNKKMVYTLISVDKETNMSKVNVRSINALSEQLRALATYYTGIAGSDCDRSDEGTVTCKLATSLGLGAQGSDKQINVFKKWFHNDSFVTKLINQKMRMSISGANSFSNFDKLIFMVSNDTVKVNYKIDYYNRGNSRTQVYNEMVVIKKDEIIFIKREYKW